MDQDRGRESRKKKYSTKERDETEMKKPIILLKSKDSTVKPDESTGVPQTILLKPRDGEKQAIFPPRAVKENGPSTSYHLAPRPPDLSSLLPTVPDMKSMTKFMTNDSFIVLDYILDHLTDSTDFLVIGCLGYQNVGKSSIMNKLIGDQAIETVFFINPHNGISLAGTQGVNAFITPDRIIFLDTEPILSISQFNHSRSGDEVENELEIHYLQLAGLLFSICHIILLIQDSELDNDLIRFIQVAEMLKPSAPLQVDDENSSDYFPYLIFIHNKAEIKTFNRHSIKFLQEFYKGAFSNSKFPISNGIGIGAGSIIRSFIPEFCGDPVNLFLLPHLDVGSHTTGYKSNFQYDELMKRMRLQLLSLPPMQLTQAPLSEKNWWHYTVKMWEDIKKSNFYTEYGRLLPSQATAKMELGNS